MGEERRRARPSSDRIDAMAAARVSQRIESPEPVAGMLGSIPDVVVDVADTEGAVATGTLVAGMLGTLVAGTAVP